MLARFSMFLSGLLFALGLIVSGMVNPAKVIGFLDLAGNWDPSLILVMVGGIAFTAPAFRFILKRPTPLFEHRFYLPTRVDIDRKLLGGAALFGVGWGMAGLCPGPSLTGLSSFNSSVALFVISMIAGMTIYRLVGERPSPSIDDAGKLTN